MPDFSVSLYRAAQPEARVTGMASRIDNSATSLPVISLRLPSTPTLPIMQNTYLLCMYLEITPADRTCSLFNCPNIFVFYRDGDLIDVLHRGFC